MPVGAPLKPDFVKEIDQEKTNTYNDDEDTEEYFTKMMQTQTNPPKENLLQENIA